MSKQTAIEWLMGSLERVGAITPEFKDSERYYAIIEQAKDMEWEQISKAHLAGYGHIVRIVSKAIPMDHILEELEEMENGGYYQHGYMYYLETYEGINEKSEEDEEEQETDDSGDN